MGSHTHLSIMPCCFKSCYVYRLENKDILWLCYILSKNRVQANNNGDGVLSLKDELKVSQSITAHICFKL